MQGVEVQGESEPTIVETALISYIMIKNKACFSLPCNFHGKEELVH